jgi:hypothetical protein
MPIGSFKVVGVDTFKASDADYLIVDFWTFEEATLAATVAIGSALFFLQARGLFFS